MKTMVFRSVAWAVGPGQKAKRRSVREMKKARTLFDLDPRGVDVERDEADAVGENFIDDDRSVIPYIDIFDRDTRNLAKTMGVCS